MKEFCEIRLKYVRAMQVWQILIGLASNRQIITLELLGQIIEVESARTISSHFELARRYCSKNDVLPLDTLVVNVGNRTAKNGDLDREDVFNYDWYDLYPPSEKDFEKLYANG